MSTLNGQKQINQRIKELVEAGYLIEVNGSNKLHRQILKEFKGCKLGKRAMNQRIWNMLWSKKSHIDKALQEVVRRYPDPKDEDLQEDFCHLYPYIPFDMVKRRARWHHGISTKKMPRGGRKRTLPGIGRIGLDLNPEELKKFKMPAATLDKPFKINVPDPETWSLMFLNGANIGTRHGGDIVGNVSRRALSDANEREDAAVIMTNIIAVDLKKTAGPPKVGRSLIFGDNVNPDLIKDPGYRKIVKKILNEHPADEVVYRTPEELVDDILNGWMKIALKPNRKPEYRGPVYVILGHNENELIKTAAYWELRWWTVRKQRELRGKLQIIKKARKDAEEMEDFKLVRKLTQDEDSVLSQLNRTTMSSIATQEVQRFYELARAVVVKKIEKMIPNAKVIGQDTSYLEVAGKKLEVFIPPHRKVSDSLLANYAIKYGPKNLQGRLAPLVVITHPWALQFRMTVREADYDGRRGSSKIFVAPIAIDEAYLRSVLKAGSSQDHQMARAVFTEGFQPGVLRLNSVGGVVNPDVLSVPSLESFENYPTQRRKNKNSIYHRGPNYLWFMFGSDPHWGGRAKEFVTSAERGIRLDMAGAVFEMMRKAGLCRDNNMRVHVFASPDDQVQGSHFKARTQPHPHQLSSQEIERRGRELLQLAEGKTAEQTQNILKKMHEFYTYQNEVRGSDNPLEQMMQMMERNIEANVDIFRAILKRSVKTGLILRGVGDFSNKENEGFDTRNCGFINIGSGNHFGRTVEEEIVEGPLYAKLLRSILTRMPEWRGKEKELEKLVTAPLYSGEFIGWATIQAPGGHEYGLDLRATPTRMSGWGDTLLGATRNLPMRGNYSRIFNNRLPILSVCGDKHFFGAAITDCAFFHMCASGTHTDRYGELGFPPNNTGISFIGLPADGPNSGPMLVRILPFDVIKDFVEENPRSFDWETFLPNPA